MPPPARADHDHRHCVDGALGRAERICALRGIRLTVLRRRVLELVWSSHRPRGAYAILDNLGEDGRKPAPLTVYRALDFLVGNGLVHRIESLNAYVGCPEPGSSHTGQFLVCEVCGTVVELNDQRVSAAIQDNAREHGFTVTRPMIEIRGRCPACQESR
ncbi:MAG: Fur family transcriptional regulator [Azospirillaceae bacterium]|nr:Fur family transcriptional regulator [Azospirillaceae bacterium]